MLARKPCFLFVGVVVVIASLLTTTCQSFEIKQTFCTAEELRETVVLFCKRFSMRTSFSNVDITPYGSIGNADSGSSNGHNINLVQVMNDALRIGSSDKLSNLMMKRDGSPTNFLDHLALCCQEGCTLRGEDLLPHCKDI